MSLNLYSHYKNAVNRYLWIHLYNILINSITFTLQASATVIPYWYLADIDRGIVKDKFIVGWIFCKHIIIAFIKFSWAIFVKAVSFSENSLKKKKNYYLQI